MDDAVGSAVYILIFVIGGVVGIVAAIMECMAIRRRRRRQDEEAVAAWLASIGAVRLGARLPVSAIALKVLELDDVSLPRQHQGGASAGDRSATAADIPECVFCLGELEEGEEWVVLTACHHEFHRKCMAKWLEQKKRSCPTCRAVLRPGVLPQTPALADMV